MSLKTIAVIPVHGRLPLVSVTIDRLYNKNGINHVICVGSTEEEQSVCTSAGAEFLNYPNKPLGRKWNHGFKKAQEYKPDFVVYVGSSDWISDNWLPVMTHLAKDFAIVGKPDFNILHINKGFKLGNWPGYPSGSGREFEPIGGGRMLNAGWLDSIGWKPFDNYLNGSMDYSMMKKLDPKKDLVMVFNSPEIQIMAISCERWSNMHFRDFDSGGVIKFRNPEEWLKIWFPEALNLNL